MRPYILQKKKKLLLIQRDIEDLQTLLAEHDHERESEHTHQGAARLERSEMFGYVYTRV